MTRRKKDKLLQDMARIHRARKRRRAQNNGDKLKTLKDSVMFKQQEFSALGRDVGKGVVREAGSITKDGAIEGMNEGMNLATDMLVGIVTFGMVDPPSRSTKVRRRR